MKITRQMQVAEYEHFNIEQDSDVMILMAVAEVAAQYIERSM